MADKLTKTTAVELWKRWFDWSGDPWVSGDGWITEDCFFCGEDKPNHEPHCVYITAKELVSLDEKGELE